MTQPLLTLMMPGLAKRPWQLTVDRLQQQIRQLPTPDAVELLTDVDAGVVTSGVKRNRLTARAQGQYLAFVDDDDEQADDYVASLLQGCQSGADVVTFCLRMTRDGAKPEKWTFGLTRNHRMLGLMCVNHLCAWRAEIARRVCWAPQLGYADDQCWFQPLFHAGVIQSQWHIPRVLYRYLFVRAQTANQQLGRINEARRFVGAGLRCFRDEADEILIDAASVPKLWSAATVRVRNRHGAVIERRRDGLSHYHTIKIG